MISREKFSKVLRRKVETYSDPYLADLKPTELAICRECRSVYVDKRWELESQATKVLENAKTVVETLCPACEKIRDRMPGGIVRLTGRFVTEHEDEIVNLLHHQNDAAMENNPLERIMDIEESGGGMVVMTTNERLAQKIGRALHKSYSGVVEYKWSKGTKLARVNWMRD